MKWLLSSLIHICFTFNEFGVFHISDFVFCYLLHDIAHLPGNPFVIKVFQYHSPTLQWRHNERNGVSNHRRLGGLLKRLFRRISKKHQSSASLAFVRAIHGWPVNSLHKQMASNAKNVSLWWRHDVEARFRHPWFGANRDIHESWSIISFIIVAD